MITITIIGLDQYAIGTYSQLHTKKLADLFEVKSDELFFYAPNSFFYHEGVDQTSWNTLVRVHAPRQVEILENKITTYLLSTLIEFGINITIEFFYFDMKNSHTHINNQYPRFITEQNNVVIDDEHEEEEEEIYEGNVFADIEEKTK
ncbi:MAG: hypothetical protein EOM77_03800 [Bacteroidia bacterium]|nr:hypothetical protein [Bacteroidia bacterium]